jgi:hypothetical protein
MEAEDLGELLEGPLDKRVSKILSTALTLEWNPNPITLVARFSKSPHLPFFMRWDLNPETMKWRFGGSRVGLVRPGFSGKLTLKDALTYLEHPEVIQEEDPTK